MIKVLFVCLGNICRSPTAEGVFQQLLVDEGLGDRILVDSAGTGNWHVGNPPDSRAQQAAEGRGLNISGLRGRQVSHHDFGEFDYILAMDRSNLADLKAMAPASFSDRISLFLSHTENYQEDEVPDPYYGGGFDLVFDMIESASRDFLAVIRQQHGL